ncbi:MAG: flagellar export protein FliJ [bacterium]
MSKIKQFEFSLEKVLRIKIIEEDVIKSQLGKIQQEINKCKKNIEEMYIQKEKYYSLLRKQVNVNEILQTRNYLNFYETKIKELEYHLKLLEQEFEECRFKLIKKKQKKETLEKLKEKEYKKFHQNHLKNEQKTLDEINNIFVKIK